MKANKFLELLKYNIDKHGDLVIEFYNDDLEEEFDLLSIGKTKDNKLCILLGDDK